nr:uncharacterized protein I206_06479 [Kwoniella pini CBS 10737]OCF47576.1 hypothetical protein I206_06479 [Kwoniella pini CBS 10737]
MLLVLLPSPWHLRARNVATLSLIFWLLLANIVTFVNSLMWADNFRDLSPVWCDISGRVLLLISYALPACSLAQMRRLEFVASTRRSIISAKDRKRRIIEELTICIVVPCVLGALFYVVQGHRYDIVENIGCIIPVYTSVPGIIMRYVVPGSIAVASLVFASLAIRWFLIRRLQFQTILAASDSSLSTSRYLRLVALAVTDSAILIAYTIYDSTPNSDAPLLPYQSWKAVHLNFDQFAQYPEELLGTVYPIFVANVYAPFLYSIIFFAFFGFGEEAISGYLTLASRFMSLLERIGFRRNTSAHRFDDQNFTLGSKIMPADGDAVSFGERPEDVATATEQQAKPDYRLGKTGYVNQLHDGVAVTVERSIV